MVKKIKMTCSNCKYFKVRTRMKETRVGVKRVYRQGYCAQWKKYIKSRSPCSKWVWVKDKKFIDFGFGEDEFL